jgi:ketosteroid isomerase-like protein
MYHTIMKAKLRQIFAQLNQGHYDPVLASLAPSFSHSFAGSHCLGGARSSLSAYRSWFERLFEVFPDIKFEITNLVVHGPPWNTWVTVEWNDTLTTKDGIARRNSGAHVMHFKWTKATEVRIYIDTERVAQFCAIQYQHGVSAAGAAQILDA